MSYSINAKAATKAELEAKVREDLARIPTQQPVHEADIAQATDAAVAFINLLPDDPAQDAYCSVSGSIWKTDSEGVKSASVSVNVSLQSRSA